MLKPPHSITHRKREEVLAGNGRDLTLGNTQRFKGVGDIKNVFEPLSFYTPIGKIKKSLEYI